MKTFATPARAEPSALKACPICGGRAFSPLWRLEGFSFARCRACGLIQQNPQPLEEAVLARYDAGYLAYEEARQYDYRDLELLALGDLRFGERTGALVARARAEGRKPAFLDVGCATGALLVHFRDAGWQVAGAETCAGAAAYGRERHGLDIRSATLATAGFEAGSYEVVHASHLIEHLNDPTAFLACARSLLRPGGLLFITTPNADGFQARLLGGGWRSAINDHLYLFSAASLDAMLSKAGFRTEARLTWGGWAEGLRPRFLKRPLDRAAKRHGRGDVMACVASCPPEAGEA